MNRETDKYIALRGVWSRAENGSCEILTSVISQVEVFKKKCEKNDAKPLSDTQETEISKMFWQQHVILADLDPIVADNARKLLREHEELQKAPDAIHLATALYWSPDAMHTYDGVNLLGLNGKVKCRDGRSLKIVVPDESVFGPLFGDSLSAGQ